jgi:pimeloyl-ACP methyl ester carboxylesterase
VLFIQGIGVVGACWRPQVDHLSKNFQTLLFDNRGIGKSQPCHGPITIETMADDALALLDAVGWDSAHVVGHSMGGIIAQQLALDSPKRIRSLSLLCTFGRAKDGARLTPWVIWMTLRTRLGTKPMRRRAFLEMLWPRAELQKVDLNELAMRVGLLVGRDLAQQPPVLMKQVKALARHDTSKRLGELAGIPTFVLSAEHDPIALSRYGRALANSVAEARFELMLASSHGVTIQRANEVNRLLQEWLSTVEKSSVHSSTSFGISATSRI